MFTMSNKIEILRLFFRVSKAAFDFSQAFSQTNNPITPMHNLHNLALEEMEKENPDLSKIDNLLAEMEALAVNYKRPQPQPNYPEGGIALT